MSEFLAEAAVLIRAQTAEFRRELQAALATVPKEIVIPIVTGAPTGAAISQSVAAAQKQATLAIQEESSAAIVAGASERQLAQMRTTAAAAATAYSKVERSLLSARLAGVTVVNGLIADEVGLAEATQAAAAAREFLTTAELQGIDSEQLLKISAIQEALAMGEAAAATRAKAVADEQAAAAAGHHAVALKNVIRGSGTAALAAIGLRGATLTANAAFIAGAASAISFGKSLASAAKFETSLNVFAATSQATSEQMQAVSESAKQLGADITLPGVNAQDAATAMLELSKAGLSVQDSLAGARGVLQLATAASIDNAQAVQITASALNAFGLSGDQAVHVADVFANAANLSQGSISDMGLALQQAAAVARQSGISFEDTAALLTLLARNGIQGSDAGTSLRVALTRLINPTGKAKKILEDLNVQVRDLKGNVRPEVFADFATAQRNLSKSQQDTNAATVFGTDALRAYAIAAREGRAGLDAAREGVDKQGTAAEQSAAKTKGLAGQWENLRNQAARLGLEIGQQFAPAASTALEIVAGGFENMASGIEAADRALNKTKPAKPFVDIAREAGNANAVVASYGRNASSPLLERAAAINNEIAAAAGRASPKLLEEQRAIQSLIEQAPANAIQGLLDKQKELNDALDAALGPGVAATKMVEGYRDALHNAALEAEGLRNRIDETTDRFAQQPPTPVAPTGPTPVGPTAKLDRRAALAAATGNLTLLESIQKEALARAKKALANSHGNVKQRTALFNKVTQAEAALATTQKQIADDAAAKQKKRTDDAKRARTQADQDFLDALTGGRAPIERKVTKAERTETLVDDIKRQRQLRARVLAEIDRISKRQFVDSKTKAAAISARRDKLVEIDNTIISLQGQQTDIAAKAATEKFNLQVAAAEAAGNTQLLINLFNKQIASTEKAISAAKTASAKQLELKGTLAQLQQDREDAISTVEEKRIRLAELRGNENLELKLINARIERLKKAIAAAKKQKKATLDLEIALAETQKQRDELLGKAQEDAKQGTTAFDLLKQFADTFNQNAGNLIGPNQPFAGPTGFTADIAQFLVRRPGRPGAKTTAAPSAAKTPIELNDDRLVRSLDRLTDAIERRGNVSTGTGITVPVLPRNRRMFVEAHQTREAVEARSGV